MVFSVFSRIQLFIVLIIGGLTIALAETAPPPNASVYIISPKDPCDALHQSSRQISPGTAALWNLMRKAPTRA